MIKATSKYFSCQMWVPNEAEDILLLGDTINKAVLDSGASRTVCGKEWYDRYVDSLSQETRAGLKELPSDTIFRFGVGKLKADKVVHLPVKLSDKEILIEVHVVQTDIPLLLSLKTMKKMGMQIDFEKDRVALEEETFGLEITSSGHYALSLSQGMEKNPDAYVSVPIKEGESETHLSTKKKALKLHRRKELRKDSETVWRIKKPIYGLNDRVTDSMSFWDNIYSSSQAQDLKLRREVVSIREQLEMKEVQEVKWIPSELQLADGLTKGTASPESLIHVLTSGQFNNNL